MNQRLNKPRVFLSHSKADSGLIERLHGDLQVCQIEPWIDTVDIRHGKPWLDAIFEEGIPTCDCVLVYLTEHSVTSAMVKKELDAAVLEQLRDKRVALLPYVSSEALRDGLRADIRALQVPVLNTGNYQSLLPRIVAEVWRSFMERTVPVAVQQEHIRRLEAELELEKLRKASGDGIFTQSEENEFTYIYARLNRQEVVELQERRTVGGKQEAGRKTRFSVAVLPVLSRIADSRHCEYSSTSVVLALGALLEPHTPGYDPEDKAMSLAVTCYPALADELLMYGFVQRVHRARAAGTPAVFAMMGRGSEYHFVYTDRWERFRYWLAFKGFLSGETGWSVCAAQEDSAPVDVKAVNGAVDGSL
jgi:hypothetical protein